MEPIFLTLTYENGTPVCVNFMHVVRFYSNEDGSTNIMLIGPVPEITVQETTEQIIFLLRKYRGD